MRRCGKSTYLHQIIQKLLNKGVSPQNILYLNFFDDRLHNLRHDNLSIILDAYYSLFPEKKSREKVYCFFDEIQAVTGWEPFVDRLMRTENCQVYLTGSSAHMLSTEIATQMRGRALSWELFPFSFREFLNAGDVDFSNPLSSKKQLLIRKAFEEYWLTGGFPEVFKLDKNLRIKIHQEYFQAILFRDLVERHDVSHPKAVSDLAYWLVDNTASMYSINKLTGYLKSLGHKVPKATVSDYLKWFEKCLLPVQRKTLRRLTHSQPSQPQKGVLHRPLSGNFGFLRSPGKLRTSAGKHRICSITTGISQHILLSHEVRQGDRFCRTSGPKPKTGRPGLRNIGRSTNTETGNRRVNRIDGRTQMQNRNHNHQKRGGAD